MRELIKISFLRCEQHLTGLCFVLQNRDETDGPPEKKMKHTSQVVVDQPEDPDKIVIDSVRDTTSWIEEVKSLGGKNQQILLSNMFLRNYVMVHQWRTFREIFSEGRNFLMVYVKWGFGVCLIKTLLNCVPIFQKSQCGSPGILTVSNAYHYINRPTRILHRTQH